MKSSDIVNKVFTKSFMGYDVREVDAFLDDLIVELETLQKQRAELTKTVESLLRERKRAGIPAETADRLYTLPRLEGAAPRTGKPRRIAAVSIDSMQPDDDSVLSEEDIFKMTEAVALEIETGSAAPRAKTIAPEIRKVVQNVPDGPSSPHQKPTQNGPVTSAPADAWKRSADRA